jgi:hypothetical protein
MVMSKIGEAFSTIVGAVIDVVGDILDDIIPKVAESFFGLILFGVGGYMGIKYLTRDEEDGQQSSVPVYGSTSDQRGVLV